MLRLNVAVPPKQPSQQSQYGLLGGDAAGFPNGRRVGDNVTAIELRAIAGVTIPLVDPSFTPDAAAGQSPTAARRTTSRTAARSCGASRTCQPEQRLHLEAGPAGRRARRLMR